MNFPDNEISKLLDVDKDEIHHNLGESSSLDLEISEILNNEEIKSQFLQLRLGYNSLKGMQELRELIAADASSEENRIEPNDILTTVGAAASLFLTVFSICKPGDKAIVISPNFPASIDVLFALQLNVQMLKLKFENGYQVDIDELSSMIDDEVKFVSITSPNNPTGVLTSNQKIKSIINVIKEKSPKCKLFVDETYRDAAYGESIIEPSAATVDPAVISISSLSKAMGAPGLRIGWLITKDQELLKRLAIAKMNVFICCSNVDEFLAIALLRRKQEFLAKQRAHLTNAVSLTRKFVSENHPFIEWVEPERGALCCIRLSDAAYPSDDHVKAFHDTCAKEFKILVGKGSWFYETDRLFRVGFGYLPLERLPPALEALSSAIKKSVN